MKSQRAIDIANEILELLKLNESCDIYARQINELVDKLQNREITISVIGQFKRGKSTLSNAILGEDVMPVGIVPITSAVTKAIYGEKSAEIRFKNGEIKPVDFSDLHLYVSEQENNNNRLQVHDVTVKLKSDFLKDGVVYVDTPGVGSFHENNTNTAYDYIKESDAVMFLLSVDSPINQIEIELLKNTTEFAGKFYFIANKAETVSEDDLKAYIDYCKSLISELMKIAEVKIFPVSAKEKMGIDELKKEIMQDISAEKIDIMEISAKRKMIDIIRSVQTQLKIYWKAMNMEYTDLDKKFNRISELISEIQREAPENNSHFQIRLNETKQRVSNEISKLFEIKYDMPTLYIETHNENMSKKDFLREVDKMCKETRESLSKLLLYREEDAYVVVRKLEDANKIERNLFSIENRLKRQLEN